MSVSDVDLVLIRAAANGDITFSCRVFWWRGARVTSESMHVRLTQLIGADAAALVVTDILDPSGHALVAPSGSGRRLL